ncbi:DUF2075 domain-containing protein [Rhodoblastus acidophilus]|uniref:DUF2075 domain-containing protein n=1 Tax=Candidatus Rhodoblastus alkanivorans TaxID=2954117 RepID=A0ABS9Z4S9_9HYPH|nr:DNA/RNA helicase domain-containing protein [Candidatus Rhodoblastus alkanivorans]MCI4677666.1 DUF2075 domain-containing protein [Candidatus Rhodoblastus alkanivorans]MCI4682602.1 DUF2075 domain-containing protein [Candidatus Rhodoblastus alkanivorans]MDI4639908.1 DUF2075 domain-containing protein [Rhodoblastus acidophilus]
MSEQIKIGESLSKTNAQRSFYRATVEEFLTTLTAEIVGHLSSRHVALHSSAQAEQIRAWEAEIAILHDAFSEMDVGVYGWSISLEVSLFRLAKRLDAVVLAPGVVAVVEFKIGEKSYLGAHKAQLERYACSLKDFHEASQSRLIVPILCADCAPQVSQSLQLCDGVANILFANRETLIDAFRLVAAQSDFDALPLDGVGFDASAYRPTPTIVEAAQALYQGHAIADIGRGDAADEELQAAAQALRDIVSGAETLRRKIVCFVTGAPGAGKTLLGLDLALKLRSGERPAALLSGNRPLVHVLTEALATDSARRGQKSKAAAKYEADSAIQNLLGYLKEHTDGAKPPEHVIVFDEAQRAWNAEVGQELMGRAKSEPALFLEILDRLEWCCLVCLVGPGQEINRGEGGLPLWAEAIADSIRNGVKWEIVAAPAAIDGGQLVCGDGLASDSDFASLDCRRVASLHLANAIRSYRNPLHGFWVAALLESDLVQARGFADQMDEPPTYLTRDLERARAWLRERRRGQRSVGLLCSSGAVRLVGDGVPPALRSNELSPIGHWFLKPYSDFRSGSALETPVSEYGCQGLEVDFAALCWGGDLIWDGHAFAPRRMQAPRWQKLRDPEKRRFRLNAYRVLLTRARAGTIIFIPSGSEDDPTRSPAEFDQTAAALLAAGCEALP